MVSLFTRDQLSNYGVWIMYYMKKD